MEKCPHVEKLTVSKDLSLLDPSKWLCSVCGTTEWVWACLSCAHVACGRLNEKHAVSHYEATKHHIAIEINEKYVFCYTCDDYIMEDNSCGDLEAIRSALTAIGTMSFEGVGRKGGNLLRSFSHQQEFSFSHTAEDDRLITAQIHYRKSVLDKVFTAWLSYVQKAKKEKKRNRQSLESSKALGHSRPPPMVTRSRSGLFLTKKRTLIPGVTGLRNLGNTCYINSIIQSLGHLEDFREYFCQLVFDLFSPVNTPALSSNSSFSPDKGPLAAARQLLRLNTIDYYQHLNTVPAKSPGGRKGRGKAERSPVTSHKAGGLNGGRAEPAEVEVMNDPTTNEAHVMKAKAHALSALSLCQELHGLLRVLWSGKWAQVSPHGFLHSVWRAIPVFKGHAQHDAQEFLCELLDKLSQEIENLPQCKGSDNIVDHSFRGELVSQVTCLSCKNTSRRYEPFLDLSLEFPPLFQQTTSQSLRKMCHLTEMLYKFTEYEELEPKSYSCEKCNSKRRRSKTGVKTDASKQLLISKPPEILRLHLKRFRWCGRNNREKINTHVAFDEVVDISPFCLDRGSSIPGYRLQAVVVHHGAGFRAGHYTAYTYNNTAGSWVHCNDSRVNLVSEEEVLLSQAYILFYTREMPQVDILDMPTLTPEYSMSLSKQSTMSTMPDLDVEDLKTLRRLSQGETEQFIDDDISISFQRDPTLISRLSSAHSVSDLKRAATSDFTGSSSPSPSPSSCKKQKRLSHEKTKSPSQLRLTSSRSDSSLRKVMNSKALPSNDEALSPERVNMNADTQKVSSVSPDSGMKRANSSSLNLESWSPLSRHKIMRFNSDNQTGNFTSATVASISSSPRKTTQISSADSIGCKSQSPALTKVKKETSIKTNTQSSSSSSSSRQSLQRERTATSMSNLQKLSLNSLFSNLKREATNSSTPKRLPSPAKKIQPTTLEKCNRSSGNHSPTITNVKCKPSTPDTQSSTERPLDKQWTPQKSNYSSRQRKSPISVELNTTLSPNSNSKIASPSKTTKALTKSKKMDIEEKSTVHPGLRKEDTLLLNPASPLTPKEYSTRSPQKLLSTSPQQLSQSSPPRDKDINFVILSANKSPRRDSHSLSHSVLIKEDSNSSTPNSSQSISSWKLNKTSTPEKVIRDSKGMQSSFHFDHTAKTSRTKSLSPVKVKRDQLKFSLILKEI